MLKITDGKLERWMVILTTLWLVSFTVFETQSWGKYVYLGLSIVIFMLGAVKNHMKVLIRIEPLHLCTIAFLIFGFASMIWAIDGLYTVNRMSTVARTLICIFIVYTCYQKDDDATRLLDCVMWAGYIVALYAIKFYGLARIRSLVAAGNRIDNAFTNVNAIGMMASYSFVITFSKIANKHLTWGLILSLPALLMVVASGSRKAFIVLVVGVFFVYFAKTLSKSRNPIETIFKFVAVCFAGIAFIGIIWVIPAFKPITERMVQTINQFTGNGIVDESTIRRANFIRIGLEQFLKTPLLGIGIGNSLFLIGRNTYLHNNYVELLACGGMIGSICFYGSYIYCLKWLLRGLAKYDEISVLCCIFLVLQLIMDFMQVSYFSKDTYFYFMIFFLQAKRIRAAAEYDHNEI